jgi:hypothetical protein
MDLVANQPVVYDLGTWTYGRKEVVPFEMPKHPTLGQIKRLQDAVGTLPNQIEFKPEHYFAPGMYLRELAIAGDSVVVGKMHRHEHLVMLVSGEATVWTDKGMERITGPKVWKSPAGVKRALYTHSDCLFYTMHATDETDLEVIEADTIIPEAQIEYSPQPTEQAALTNALQGVYA